MYSVCILYTVYTTSVVEIGGFAAAVFSLHCSAWQRLRQGTMTSALVSSALARSAARAVSKASRGLQTTAPRKAVSSMVLFSPFFSSFERRLTLAEIISSHPLRATQGDYSYLHDEFMYTYRKAPGGKLKTGVCIFGGLSLGVYIPIFSVNFNQRKAGNV